MTQKEVDPRVTTSDDATIDKETAHDAIQQGADHSIPKQEQLKRAVQQHPQRELPRIESIELPETPPRV